MLQALRDECPGLRATGVGGGCMQQAGLDVLADISHLAVIGFIEVAGAALRLRRVARSLVKHMERERPDALILIDYPGFNLRLAKRARAEGIRVIYYISPQVWAWGANRIPLIARLVDKMLVVFPFEKELHARTGLDVEFVGHPLLDRLPADTDRARARGALDIPAEGCVIGLLPGSRAREVRAHLPVMLGAARVIEDDQPGCRFIIPCADPLEQEFCEEQVRRHGAGLDVLVVKGKTHEAILAANLVLVASGTATIESACLRRPMIVIYRVSFLTWLVVRSLIRLPDIGLVNIVAGKRIVPEFLQYDAKPYKIGARALQLLEDRVARNRMESALDEVRVRLGKPGASRRAALAVLAAIES